MGKAKITHKRLTSKKCYVVEELETPPVVIRQTAKDITPLRGDRASVNQTNSGTVSKEN